MTPTRRSALAAIGGVAIGGGALLGSGAFSSTEATRAVEVNVATDDTDLGTADVEVDTNYESVYAADAGGNYDDETDLGRYSLLANPNPTIFLGGDGENELPQNASVTFNQLLYVENLSSDPVSFDIAENTTTGSNILDITQNHSTPLSGNSEGSYDVTVDTPSDSNSAPDDTTAIDITITPQ